MINVISLIYYICNFLIDILKRGGRIGRRGFNTSNAGWNTMSWMWHSLPRRLSTRKWDMLSSSWEFKLDEKDISSYYIICDGWIVDCNFNYWRIIFEFPVKGVVLIWKNYNKNNINIEVIEPLLWSLTNKCFYVCTSSKLFSREIYL